MVNLKIDKYLSFEQMKGDTTAQRGLSFTVEVEGYKGIFKMMANYITFSTNPTLRGCKFQGQHNISSMRQLTLETKGVINYI